MKADSMHLMQFLGTYNVVFEIPVFQRNYEWDKEQCRQLFNDIEYVVKSNTEHFIGAIFYVDDDTENERIYRIIDGQQRLTSIMLLLKALSVSDDSIKREIENQFLKNEYVDANNHLKLKPVAHDYDAYRGVMEDDDLIKFKPSKIVDNYELFNRLIKNSDYSSIKLFQAIKKLTLVNIILSNNNSSEDPQAIFESLNSTGAALTSSDLVRNYLMMKLTSSQQDELYNKYWRKIEGLFTTKALAEFIRHYLTVKTHNLIKVKYVYESYKQFFNSSGYTPEEALDDLYTFAEYYYGLLNGESKNCEFNNISQHMIAMKNKVVFPYFMLLLSLVHKNKISQENANELAHMIENYVFRRKVCQLPTNGINKIIVELCDIKKENGNLKKNMLRLIKSTFPEDKLFFESLQTVDLYKKKLAKLALIVLEEQETKETIKFEEAQVEHIMPQHLTNDWKLQLPNARKIVERYGGRLGNLTLTMYNQEMGNKYYDEKKKYYEQSNVSLTRDVAQKYNLWNKESIIERSKKLAELLMKVYDFPNFNGIDGEVQAGEFLLSQDISVTGRKPVKLIMWDNEYPVSSWKNLLVMYLNQLWNKDSRSFDLIKRDKQLNKKLFGTKRSPIKLENGIEIETNYSSNDIITIIQKIAEIYNIKDQVAYTLK